MEENNEKSKPAAANSPQASNSNSISDYLAAPRRKRKNYVIMALSKSFNKDLAADMEAYVKKTFGQLAISLPSNAKELLRQQGRNISLLIISDDFDNIDTVVTLVKTLKERRHRDKIPVLFLTKHAEALIPKYHDNLLVYHESDDFVQYPGAARNKVFSAIRNGIDNHNARRSRRYQVLLPITLFHLSFDKEIKADIIDLSVHGALLKSNDKLLFEIGHQLHLKIITTEYLDYSKGEVLKLAARVRRVYISGDIAAVSFEYISETALRCLSQLLLAIVTHQLERKHLKNRLDLKSHE